jgi:predicted HTH domain antitoxin
LAFYLFVVSEILSNEWIVMYQLTLTIPEETILALKIEPEQLQGEVLLAAAMKLYELGKLSSGAAANLAGIPKVVFLSSLASYGISTFKLTEAELIEDVARA